ncbi:TetR family transcriptional regulator [Paractinoplanes durhamensis]|uniref:TetR family transcriptional regulator n=1 Tax=Paractinoplanes durhamensis TaxID=113563 RepID=A0ABQ3Z4Y1_9ACTN|nr:TetR family transcriptional regulator [Actinoplanes durhamensis]GIE04870.1 TetR family transcriptional regulator [Actinoplanes durhamensis]
MAATSSYRESNRARLRSALIRAARDLTVQHGWESVRMVDVAKAVGVSRQTVYNEFDGRAGLAEALAASEVQQFAQRVRTELFAHKADIRAAAYAATLMTLDEAGRNPLVRAILTSTRGGADELLPYLTTRSEIVLTEAGGALREWAAAFLPDRPPDTLALAIDAVIRLTVSHIMLPRDTPAGTATALAEVFVRLLAD